MQDLKNSMLALGLKAGNYLTPVLKNSKFKETGNITPEEFVAAGDYLVEISPAWRWCKGSDELKKNFLPDDKQFLMTNRVPCYKRCRDIEYDCSNEKMLEVGGDEWVDTHHEEPRGSSVGWIFCEYHVQCLVRF